MKKNTKGFTLVEISIVLVIIALIVSTVISGTNVISTAKLYRDIHSMQKYKSAYANFFDQYIAVPGDMINASSIWTAATSGNGDGLIQNGEYPWQHLLLAKLIDTKPSSGSISGPIPFIARDNTVSFWMFAHGATMWGIYFGKTNSIGITGSSWLELTTSQAYSIDKKIDDGIPTKGKVTGFSEPVNDCVKQSDGTTNATYYSYVGIGSYNRLTTAGLCGLNFWLSH